MIAKERIIRPKKNKTAKSFFVTLQILVTDVWLCSGVGNRENYHYENTMEQIGHKQTTNVEKSFGIKKNVSFQIYFQGGSLERAKVPARSLCKEISPLSY
jgi:hypothetical protein